MTAVANGTYPDTASIRIDFREDTDLNTRLLKVFEQELMAHGHRLTDNGDLILRFETLVEEKLSPDKPATVVGQGGSRSGVEAMFELRLPLKKLKPVVGGRRYSLNVTLGRQNEPPIWAASAEAVASRSDRFAIQKSMVRAVVEALGQTVPSRPISIE